MSLEKYWEKRNFDITPEPRGEKKSTGHQLGYVIQKHDASRLHYDFRLELDGTLKSWAVPKGPSLDPGEKRLAVHVEDHPLDYGTFEGTIPVKQYGAGTVMLWDYGFWTPDGDAADGYRKGRLKFHLDGKKLKGGWTLVRMKGRDEDKQDNWLLIKEKDAEAKPGSADELTVQLPDSVISGRRMDEIAAGAENKSPIKERSAAQPAKAASPKPTAIDPLPDFIEAQLATLVNTAPTGENWLAEVKYDGYRMLCRLENGEARLFTRNRNDWSKKIPLLQQAICALPAHSAWIDGELLALDKQGRPSFQVLQQAFEAPSSTRWVYYAFDVLHLDGEDLRPLPLLERKRRLAELLANQPPSGNSLQLLYSDHVQGDPGTVFKHACQHQLEGIIAKRADAPWTAGRNKLWLKVKCQRRQEFVIGGYTDPAGKRQAFGALLLGYYDPQGALQYAGRVGTGFNDRLFTSLGDWLHTHETTQPAFVEPPAGASARAVHWVKPEKVAEVRFAEWTAEGLLRQAAFLGLREDKAARDIIREQELAIMDAAPKKSEVKSRAPEKPVEKPTTATKTAKQKSGRIAGVALSHPDRVLFADIGLTKLELARYYESVADWIIPHLQQRPLTLLRCPGGSDSCFFQKHIGESMPEAVEAIEVPEKDGLDTYMMVNSLAGIVGLVQMGVLELHTWGSAKPTLDEPDRLILDLDPDPAVPWQQVIEAAKLTRALLGEVGLNSLLKTTGGKGLHLVIPLQPGHSWDGIKNFSHALADHLADTLPTLFIAKASKASRENKVYVDYLRNARGATAIAAFSTRARPGAPVSMPIAWEELEHDVRSATYTVDNAAEHLRILKQDPWADYEAMRQTVTAKMLALFELDRPE